MTLFENFTDEKKEGNSTCFREFAVKLPNDSNKNVMVNLYTLGSSFIVMKPACF